MERCDPFEGCARWWCRSRSPAVPPAGRPATASHASGLTSTTFTGSSKGRSSVFVFDGRKVPRPTCRGDPGQLDARRRGPSAGHRLKWRPAVGAAPPGLAGVAGLIALVVSLDRCAWIYGGAGFRRALATAFHRAPCSRSWPKRITGRPLGPSTPRTSTANGGLISRLRSLQDSPALEPFGGLAKAASSPFRRGSGGKRKPNSFPPNWARRGVQAGLLRTGKCRYHQQIRRGSSSACRSRPAGDGPGSLGSTPGAGRRWRGSTGRWAMRRLRQIEVVAGGS